MNGSSRTLKTVLIAFNLISHTCVQVNNNLYTNIRKTQHMIKILRASFLETFCNETVLIVKLFYLLFNTISAYNLTKITNFMTNFFLELCKSNNSFRVNYITYFIHFIILNIYYKQIKIFVSYLWHHSIPHTPQVYNFTIVL